MKRHQENKTKSKMKLIRNLGYCHQFQLYGIQKDFKFSNKWYQNKVHGTDESWNDEGTQVLSTGIF